MNLEPIKNCVKYLNKQVYCSKENPYGVKKVIYYNDVPQFLRPKLIYFVRDFIDDYSDQLDEMEAGESFGIEVEYEGDLEVYFVKFNFSKKGGKFLDHNIDNELYVYCNYGSIIAIGSHLLQIL